VNVFDYNNITYSSDLIDIEIDYNEFDDLLAEIDEIYTLQAKEEDRDGFLYDLKIFEERLENADEEDRAGIEEDIADCKEEISDVEKEIADLKSRIAKRSATDGQ
jgi:septal ring factor EnvC (AmiA/AmiB activator)